jgi:hypothetical protein
MTFSTTTTTTDLVLYIRHPRFEFLPSYFLSSSSSNLNTKNHGIWNPWALLGLPMENESTLLACLPPENNNSILSTTSNQSPNSLHHLSFVRKRARMLRDAYMELASRFHPDALEQLQVAQATSAREWSSSTTAPWISPLEHFNAITNAYRLLDEPVAALALLRSEYLINHHEKIESDTKSKGFDEVEKEEVSVVFFFQHVYPSTYIYILFYCLFFIFIFSRNLLTYLVKIDV